MQILLGERRVLRLSWKRNMFTVGLRRLGGWRVMTLGGEDIPSSRAVERGNGSMTGLSHGNRCRVQYLLVLEGKRTSHMVGMSSSVQGRREFTLNIMSS